MTNLELLRSLKVAAAALPVAESAPETQADRPGARTDVAGQVAEYNRQTLLEIRNRNSVDHITDIDPEIFAEFTVLLTRYLADNAPGQAALHNYVRLTATYLTFIVRKPLHPPGLVFADGQRLVCQGGIFYCPVKNRQSPGVPSLCKYCVSRDSSELPVGQ
jgi:uncharacterized protein (UPF0305 family)